MQLKISHKAKDGKSLFTFKFLTQLFIRILTTGVVNIECEAKFVYERE